MPVSPARAAAFEILMQVEREDAYAGDLLHSAQFERLSSIDHGLTTEIVQGVLRWRAVLDRELADAAALKLERLDLEVLTALRMGAYQLQFLTRVPARAAIFESVELVKSARKRSASGLVNAVLRKVAQRSGDRDGAESKEKVSAAATKIKSSRDVAALASSSSHPEWLIERWVERYGLDAARAICIHDQSPPETAIRIDDFNVAAELEAEGIRLAPGGLIASARRVVSGDVTKTKAFREGRVSIQDEASQLVGLLVGNGNSFLDCCAAPGGKTAILASRNPDAMVVAVDVHPHRARLLAKRIRQRNVRVICADTRNLPFSKIFDRILVDVPCSGTGTLARNPEIKWKLELIDLKDLQIRQIEILKAGLARLEPSGMLVYSTCSLEREECEDVVNAALADAKGFTVIDCRDELLRLCQADELQEAAIDSLLSGPYLRTIPGRQPCDGFFAARIRRS